MATSVAGPASQAGLQARSLCLAIDGRTLLEGIDLHLPTGQVGAILGPNGAGKSTLLAALAGLTEVQAGQVLLDGRPLCRREFHALSRRRALLPQDCATAFDFSVHEVVELGRYPHRQCPSRNEVQIVQQAMEAVQVSHLAQRRMSQLSGGERLRVQLARVLAQIWEPPPDRSSRWLLLDEPTAALDLAHQHAVLATARTWAHAQGVGVIMVLHDLNLALRYADAVWVLRAGRLRAHGPSRATLAPALVHQVWAVQTESVHAHDGCTQLLFDRSAMSAELAHPGA